MLVRAMRHFINLETSAGIVLLFAAFFAILIANSTFSGHYEALLHKSLGFHLGDFSFYKSVSLWINEGLMTIFFFLVGLEVKREVMIGALAEPKKRILPGISALGGIVVPAAIYSFFTHNHPVYLTGWAIPCATDIAFSLGLLSLLGKRVPIVAKVFLTTLAIFDDIAAVFIIAVFYTETLQFLPLLFAGLIIGLWCILRYIKVFCLYASLLTGVFLWFFLLKAGLHATLAGIVLAFFIPIAHPRRANVPVLQQIEKKLHPWVAFGILPIFALANAGISLTNFTWHQFAHPVNLGILVGLFLGKQVGIFFPTYLSIRLGIVRFSHFMETYQLYGISLFAGVGFTMSLFIGALSFDSNVLSAGLLHTIRMGVIMGSVLSGISGLLYFLLYKKKN